MKEQIKTKMQKALQAVIDVDKELEEQHLYDEYEVLDWQDELNRISVKYYGEV